MGWAKYLEDDISIYDNRMYLRNCTVKSLDAYEPRFVVTQMHVTGDSAASHNAIQKNVEDSGSGTRAKRIGLELKFPAHPEKELVNKLRLNGWWWSNSASSWCNTDSKANRRYVKEVLKKWNPVILRTAC